MTRARWAGIGMAVLLLALAIAGWVARRDASGPTWQRRVAEAYVPPGPQRAKSHLPPDYWTQYDRVAGDILQRPVWGQVELSELRGYLARPVDWERVRGPLDTRTEAAAVEYLKWSDAVSAIGTRLAYKGPIEEHTLPEFEREITGLLDHPVGSARNQAIAHVTEMGLLDHPGPIRRRVEAMRTDPDPEVAANAVRQLEWRDRLASKGAIK